MYDNLGKLIVAKGFEKLPKIQKIAQSGNTGYDLPKPVSQVLILKIVEAYLYSLPPTSYSMAFTK